MLNTFAVEFDGVPGTRPLALPAVCASVFNNAESCLEEFKSIFRADADTTPAVITLPWNDIHH